MSLLLLNLLQTMSLSISYHVVWNKAGTKWIGIEIEITCNVPVFMNMGGISYSLYKKQEDYNRYIQKLLFISSIMLGAGDGNSS